MTWPLVFIAAAVLGFAWWAMSRFARRCTDEWDRYIAWAEERERQQRKQAAHDRHWLLNHGIDPQRLHR